MAIYSTSIILGKLAGKNRPELSENSPIPEPEHIAKAQLTPSSSAIEEAMVNILRPRHTKTAAITD